MLPIFDREIPEVDSFWSALGTEVEIDQSIHIYDQMIPEWLYKGRLYPYTPIIRSGRLIEPDAYGLSGWYRRNIDYAPYYGWHVVLNDPRGQSYGNVQQEAIDHTNYDDALSRLSDLDGFLKYPLWILPYTADDPVEPAHYCLIRPGSDASAELLSIIQDLAHYPILNDDAYYEIEHRGVIDFLVDELRRWSSPFDDDPLDDVITSITDIGTEAIEEAAERFFGWYDECEPPLGRGPDRYYIVHDRYGVHRRQRANLEFGDCIINDPTLIPEFLTMWARTHKTEA